MKPFLSRRNFLKLFPALSLFLLPPIKMFFEATRAQAGPNILIFVFDALSARHMPIYGYKRNTTPNIARFAERAIVYHAHHAGGNFTSAGTASLLTGVYPWTHRAIHIHGSVLDRFADENIFAAYPKDGFTYAYTHNILAEILLSQFRKHINLLKQTRELAVDDPEYSDRIFSPDYHVALWAEQLILRGVETKPSSLFGSLLYRLLRLNRKTQLAESYSEQFPRGIPNVDDVYFILEDAVNWLIQEVSSAPKPYLGYFHILPPHEPYNPRKEFIGIFKDGYQPVEKPESTFSMGRSTEELNTGRTEYDENLAYADEEFGRVLSQMELQGLLENTVVIVTSDHGEMFERGIAGHETPVLYEPLIHIPLLISVPGQTQRKDIQEVTSCVDLLPTIAQLSGQTRPAWAEGQVLPGFESGSGVNQRSVFAVEAKSSPKTGPLNKATIAVLKNEYKLIYYQGYSQNPPPELYNLSSDPEELQNIASANPSIVQDLQKEIEGKIS
jgi:arylsulfatase A-like enzyme